MTEWLQMMIGGLIVAAAMGFGYHRGWRDAVRWEHRHDEAA